MNGIQALPLFKRRPRHSSLARFLHWSYAPAVLFNIFSGLYINRPAYFYGFKNMDSARKTHAIAQFVLISSFLARIAYGLKDQNYKEILPNRKTLRSMPAFLKHEFFLTDKKPKFPKYNPGQKVIFTGFALLMPLHIVTGLALYFSNSWQKAAKVAGGLNPLRNVHFLTALATGTLVAVHIYFVLTHGFKTLKSIFTGYE